MDEFLYLLYTLRRYFAVLGILGGIATILYVLAPRATPPVELQQAATPRADMIRQGKAAIPAYTEAVATRLAASTGFQALASYTDKGFEPSRISIKQGETVRFTNNSSQALWIAAGGERLYPSPGSCGSSSLDSCAPVEPMDFWEFTFEIPGEWGVVNNLEKERVAIIFVR